MGRSVNDWTVNFRIVFRCGHPNLRVRPTILVSLECAGSHGLYTLLGCRDTVVFPAFMGA